LLGQRDDLIPQVLVPVVPTRLVPIGRPAPPRARAPRSPKPLFSRISFRASCANACSASSFLSRAFSCSSCLRRRS
jgi:hypothetical protein